MDDNDKDRWALFVIGGLIVAIGLGGVIFVLKDSLKLYLATAEFMLDQGLVSNLFTQNAVYLILFVGLSFVAAALFLRRRH